MTRGFTWCGEWRQVAENADSPLEFPTSINHGTHIPDGAPGRMGGSAPWRVEVGSGRGFPRGNTPDLILGLAPLQRRGLGSEFPRVSRETA